MRRDIQFVSRLLVPALAKLAVYPKNLVAFDF